VVPAAEVVLDQTCHRPRGNRPPRYRNPARSSFQCLRRLLHSSSQRSRVQEVCRRDISAYGEEVRDLGTADPRGRRGGRVGQSPGHPPRPCNWPAARSPDWSAARNSNQLGLKGRDFYGLGVADARCGGCRQRRAGARHFAHSHWRHYINGGRTRDEEHHRGRHNLHLGRQQQQHSPFSRNMDTIAEVKGVDLELPGGSTGAAASGLDQRHHQERRPRVSTAAGWWTAPPRSNSTPATTLFPEPAPAWRSRPTGTISPASALAPHHGPEALQQRP